MNLAYNSGVVVCVLQFNCVSLSVVVVVCVTLRVDLGFT